MIPLKNAEIYITNLPNNVKTGLQDHVSIARFLNNRAILTYAVSASFFIKNALRILKIPLVFDW